MIKGKSIEFSGAKYFDYVMPLGAGGTGDAHLFKDNLTDIDFAFKKYSPKNVEYIEEHYERFIDEIKILFNITHPHIVRVYNYYLYPNSKTGYLQMEYFKGYSIDKYDYGYGWGKDWNEIFSDLVSAFEYLEKEAILHRDIRPANILIDDDGNIKIIDFGFGKKLKTTEKNGRSVVLNWPVTVLPDETENHDIYNHQTEIYFLGKLVKSIIDENKETFKYNHIIERMVKINPDDRYKSFFEVSQDISLGVLSESAFSDSEKEVYLDFAKILSSKINFYIDKYEPVNSIQNTLDSLAEIIRKNSLEDIIQDNSMLINAFINGRYNYSTKKNIDVNIVNEFYKMLNNLTDSKKKVVFDNIYSRLSTIKIELEYDDIPF